MSPEAENLLKRAEAVEFPFVLVAGSQHLAGEESWRKRLPDLGPGQLAEVSNQLGAHEEQAERAARVAASLAADDEQRTVKTLNLVDPAPDDFESHAEIRRRREAAEDARRSAEPATRGQIEELIELNRRILETLERGGPGPRAA